MRSNRAAIEDLHQFTPRQKQDGDATTFAGSSPHRNWTKQRCSENIAGRYAPRGSLFSNGVTGAVTILDLLGFHGNADVLSQILSLITVVSMVATNMKWEGIRYCAMKVVECPAQLSESNDCDVYSAWLFQMYTRQVIGMRAIQLHCHPPRRPAHITGISKSKFSSVLVFHQELSLRRTNQEQNRDYFILTGQIQVHVLGVSTRGA
jgi:hypothetical protein